jgi:hypothetical protein
VAAVRAMREGFPANALLAALSQQQATARSMAGRPPALTRRDPMIARYRATTLCSTLLGSVLRLPCSPSGSTPVKIAPPPAPLAAVRSPPCARSSRRRRRIRPRLSAVCGRRRALRQMDRTHPCLDGRRRCEGRRWAARHALGTRRRLAHLSAALPGVRLLPAAPQATAIDGYRRTIDGSRRSERAEDVGFDLDHLDI